MHLPIEGVREELRALARERRSFVLSAPTGSGKSTQVPQYLREALGDSGQVVVLEPRRMAARMLARRVAAERQGRLGDEVGYQVRFEGVRSAATRILFLTEGLFLRQVLEAPTLPGVAAVLFDEFHERHLDGDVALALAKAARSRRPDLMIGVMSATLEVEGLLRYLPEASRVEALGRTFPVDIRYLGPAQARAESAAWDRVAEVFPAVAGDTSGDVLVFMPGAMEIRRTIEALRETRLGRECLLLPLHGELPPDQQDAALEPTDRRKVIVATNVAETSLTIPGVRIVIDSGLARIPRYDPARGLNTLLVERISRASADQRAGRAGRTAPGVCWRLWTEAEQVRMAARTDPEVARVDLTEVALSLRVSGYQPRAFDWLEAPEPAALDRAEQLLRDLRAVGEGGHPTPEGHIMARFPLHPRLARFFLRASEFGCLPSAAIVAALNDGRPLLMPLADKRQEQEREHRLLVGDAEQSDWLVALHAFAWVARERFDQRFCREWGFHATTARQAGLAAEQLLRQAKQMGLDIERDEVTAEKLGKALLSAFPDHLAARLNSGTVRCALPGGKRGDLDRQSVVQGARLFVSSNMEERQVRGEVTLLLSMNTAVEMAWLREVFAEDVVERETVYYDEKTKAVRAGRQVMFRDLVLESQERGEPDSRVAAPLLVERVLTGELPLKLWDEEAETWIRRVNLLARLVPESGIGLIDDDARRLFIAQIVEGSVRHRDFAEKPVLPVLRDWLTHAQATQLEKLAPERWDLPSGHKVRLRYEADGSVVLAARIQQLYDVPGKQLAVAKGRQPLIIELLAPNHRPVQITRDLDAFWTTSYPGIRKDLRGRYPKHEWREF